MDEPGTLRKRTKESEGEDMPRPKKLSYRALKQSNTIWESTATTRLGVINRLEAENTALRRQALIRIDQTMIEQRIKLAAAVGQLVEASSKAIMFIIAKESL